MLTTNLDELFEELWRNQPGPIVPPDTLKESDDVEETQEGSEAFTTPA